MSNIFITADTHFGHANILKHCHRPYSCVDEMDEDLIKKWNERVTKNDLVYHGGDFAWHSTKRYIDRLNGDIILIQGGHDRQTSSFRFVHKLLDTVIDDQPITLCHYCMRVWHRSHYNAWHLFGHSHGGLEPLGKSWDVGVDNNNYYPLSWDEIKDIMKDRSDNFNLVRRGR